MKKILALLALFVFSFTNIFALSQKEEKVIDIFIQKIESLAEKKGDNFKKNILKALEKQKTSKKFDKKTKYILSGVIDILKKDINKVELLQEEKLKQEFYNKKTEFKKYNVDFEEIKSYLLSLYSQTRKSRGLEPYVYNEKLEKTAFLWSESQKMKKSADHKRNPGDSYYDYKKITTWFKNRGVECKNKNRTTSTENIGWGNLYCTNGDCRQELKESIGEVFEFYMDEEGQSYDAHFRSVVSRELSYIGFGISIDEIEKNYLYKYYLTIHFCTEFIN